MIANSSKLLLVAVLSAILMVLLAALIFGVYDVWRQNQQILSSLSQVKHDAEVEVLVQSIRAAENSAAEDLDNFDNLILTNDKLITLIENIEGVGRALGLETNISSVEKVEGNESAAVNTDSKNAGLPQTIRISIRTDGPWASTLAFLRAIESLPYRVMIEEATFNKGEAHWQSNIVLSLNSFD